MIKIGLIGLGKMGMSHCALLNAHPNAEFVGAADTSKLLRWGLQKYSNINTFDDYKKMVDSCNLDAVVIATPTKTHFEIAHYCLSAGCAVFLEKPCCLNFQDTSKLRELAKSKHLLVQIGYHNRYIGTFKEAKRLIESGVIGDIYHFDADAYGPVIVKKKEETWRANRSEGGGCLYDYSSHVLNLVEFVVGNISDVRGTRLESIFSQSVEDGVYSTLIMEKGFTGQLSVCWSEESFRKMTTSLIVSGKFGRIEVNAQELKVFANSNHPDVKYRGWHTSYLTDHTDDVWFYLRGEEYSAQIDDFINTVTQGSADSVNSIAYSGQTDRVVELLVADNIRTDQLVPTAESSVSRQQPRLVERLRFLVNPGQSDR